MIGPGRGMACFVVAEFLLTSASRGPSAIAEPIVEVRFTQGNQKHRHLEVICALAHMTFYSTLIETMRLSCTIFEL